MRSDLAEQLLEKEMKWDLPTTKEEINKLRYLTAVKYDNYRNFGVGNRFLESLVLWLRQFQNVDEKKTAYRFITNRLLYISETQMDHLVDLTYPQRVLPILLKQTVEIESHRFSPYQIKKIRTSRTFKEIKRKTLFLGMSDGARMDAFRRKHNLNNEQVSVSYELSEDKWKRMYDDLQEWFKANKSNTGGNVENVFLIDDLLIEYQAIFVDEWRLNPLNIIYAAENDPLDIYRSLLNLYDQQTEALKPLGGISMVLSCLSSKLASIGAFMAAYEKNDVAVAHAIGRHDLKKNGIDEFWSESHKSQFKNHLHSIWLTGEPYE
jgi:hypothetical protein